jgi:hypothetical protein
VQDLKNTSYVHKEYWKDERELIGPCLINSKSSGNGRTKPRFNNISQSIRPNLQVELARVKRLLRRHGSALRASSCYMSVGMFTLSQDFGELWACRRNKTDFSLERKIRTAREEAGLSAVAISGLCVHFCLGDVTVSCL